MSGGAQDRYRLDPLMLEMLVCPLTKTQLSFDAERAELVSRAAKLAFPIRRGVPLLHVDEARALSLEEYDRLRP